MSKRVDYGKRDDNEEQIIIELAMAYVTALRQPPGAGYDLLIPWRGGLHAIEVKNPEWLPASGDRDKMLTTFEANIKRIFELNGVPYHICIDTQEVLVAIGALTPEDAQTERSWLQSHQAEGQPQGDWEPQTITDDEEPGPESWGQYWLPGDKIGDDDDS